MVGFLPCFSKLEEPSPSTFSVRSTDFANWIKMNLQRKPGQFRVMTLRHPNSRSRSCKYGEPFLINSYFGTGVNSLGFVGHLVSDATTQMPVTVWRQRKIKCTQTNVAIVKKKIIYRKGLWVEFGFWAIVCWPCSRRRRRVDTGEDFFFWMAKDSQKCIWSTPFLPWIALLLL